MSCYAFQEHEGKYNLYLCRNCSISHIEWAILDIRLKLL